MLKNRDTASNPYRVPKQPTPKWIKFSIAGLFLSNLALIVAYVMLVLPNGRCSNTCRANATSTMTAVKSAVEGSRNATAESSTDKKAVVMMSKDWPWPSEYGVIDDLEAKVSSFSGRLQNLERHLVRTESRITELEARCRSFARQPTVNTMPAITRSSYYRRDSSDVSGQVADMKTEVANLETKLDKHVTLSEKKCKDISHYRYGTKCYYVAEARITQQKAKGLCQTLFRVNGVLAIIKDELLQKFISSKLYNYGRVYWVGLERRLAGQNSSSHHSKPFVYTDGNKVQNDVWEMWTPGHRRQDGRNCVALKYDDVEQMWFWRDYNCSEGFGYVCQYEVHDAL